MPTAGNIYGKTYVPTPVVLQGDRQSSFTDPHDISVINTSISPIMSPSPPPPRMVQKLTTPKQKKSQLKTKSTGWSRQKKITVGVIIAVIVIAIIVVAIVLGILLSSKSSTTTTTTSATTQATSYITTYWTFDNTTADYYGTYNGALNNSPSYLFPTTNQPYVGVGQALNLAAASSQFFSVSSPFLDLTYKSFTIEMWIYPVISSITNYGIFGQCQCSSCINQCLYLTIRSYRLYLSFMNNDLAGTITLNTTSWYHIAVVYNYATQQQILYVAGVQDTIKSSASPYQGTNGTFWIGASQIYLGMSYFNGYIDNFKITTRAKSATEILSDASLTAYFPLDLPSPTYDFGPLGLNGSQNNTAIVTGRVNQAMRFTGSASFFNAYGFYQIALGVYGPSAFSVSLWINPSVITSCAIVQTAYSLSSYGCHNLIGIYTTLGTTGQIVVQGYAWPTIFGPFLTVNTWMHVSVTYSLTNGLRLYVNGAYYGSTGTFSFGTSGYIMYFQLGFVNYCSSSSITNAGYQGSVDEVYIHSREITQSEVSAFANP